MRFSSVAAILSLSTVALALPKPRTPDNGASNSTASATSISSGPSAQQASSTLSTDAYEGPSESSSTANNLELITKLENAPTVIDRLMLLKSNSDWKYDFNSPPDESAITSGKGGHTVKADRKLFPALVGNSVSMTLGFIGPCGFNTPHTHPRSAEINIVVEGKLGTNLIVENGAPLITNTLEKYQMTVFPQGALHTEFNPDCSPAVFVAGFAHTDPGVQQSAQTLFAVENDVLSADFGLQGSDTINGEDIDAFRKQLPNNVALGVESCLAKCGIQKRAVV